MDESQNLTERPEDTVRRLAGRLVAVEQLHQPETTASGQWCQADSEPWPCRTWKLIHPEG